MKEVWVEFSEEANAEYAELQKQVIHEQEGGKQNSLNMQLLVSTGSLSSNQIFYLNLFQQMKYSFFYKEG